MYTALPLLVAEGDRGKPLAVYAGVPQEKLVRVLLQGRNAWSSDRFASSPVGPG
jgi:hypothetical protein